MTTKTDVTLPKGITQHGIVGHDGPVYTDVMVRDIVRVAVEADRQGRMPSDDEIIAEFANAQTSDGNADNAWTLYPDELIQAVRTLLSRYGSGQLAASAEPVGPVRLRDEGSEIYLDGVQCRYSIEQGEPWPCSDTLAYAFDPGIAERIVAALNAAPVAQEPVVVAWVRPDLVADGKLLASTCSVHASQRPGYLPLQLAAPVAARPTVTDEMVSRFLGWKLSDDFAPDCGVSFKPLGHPNGWPVGTNLLTDPQARAMLEYVLQGPVATQPSLPDESAALDHFEQRFNEIEEGDGDNPLPRMGDGKRWDEYVERHSAALTGWVLRREYEQSLSAVDKAWSQFQAAAPTPPADGQAQRAVTFVHELAMGTYKPEEIEVRAKAIAKMAPLEAQQDANKMGAQQSGDVCFAIYRKRPDENGGREYFHAALYHDGTALSDGERIVKGRFVPDSSQPAPAMAEDRDSQIQAALSTIRQDYGPDSIQSASPRDYVENAVMQLIEAGYRCIHSAGAEDARDAARYRRLRRGQHWSVIDGIGDTLRAEALDAAIDAAMQQEGRP